MTLTSPYKCIQCKQSHVIAVLACLHLVAVMMIEPKCHLDCKMAIEEYEMTFNWLTDKELDIKANLIENSIVFLRVIT